jgi:hypothetical protein
MVIDQPPASNKKRGRQRCQFIEPHLLANMAAHLRQVLTYNDE